MGPYSAMVRLRIPDPAQRPELADAWERWGDQVQRERAERAAELERLERQTRERAGGQP